MLPQIMTDRLRYLEENNFIIKEPTDKSIELRKIAVEFARQLNDTKEKIVAIVLTGSSVGGYSGDGSDIDVDVLIEGKTRPILKRIFMNTPVDLQYKSFDEWKADCIENGESVTYLTHTVPIIDNSGEFQKFQVKMLSEYYSLETIKARYDVMSKIIIERSALGVRDAENGDLVSAAIRMESALHVAVSLMIYRYKGFTATSLLLSEFSRLSKLLNHTEWFERAMEYIRFNIPKEKVEKHIKEYEQIYIRMRELISENPEILKKIKRRDLGLFSAGKQLEELCSETDYIQTRDKISRALAKNNTFDAGLNIWFGIHYNFFMFSPFFYFKNVNENASAKEIKSLSFQSLYACWDKDIKELWAEIYGAEALTEKLFAGMSSLCNEILSCCAL